MKAIDMQIAEGRATVFSVETLQRWMLRAILKPRVDADYDSMVAAGYAVALVKRLRIREETGR